MNASPPATCAVLLVAAPSSGAGKTTVAAGLARSFSRRGLRVRAFKCGPDFIDPHWLAIGSGAPVHQLDPWMTGLDDCRARLHEAASESDLLVIEGMMGLFDGQPSAADLAVEFGLPVMAVIDASAMAGTFGALALGLREYRPGMRWAGVLANLVAGIGHANMLREGLHNDAEWLGWLPADSQCALPERHLGLTLSAEVDDGAARVDAMANLLEQHAPELTDVANLQRWRTDFAGAFRHTPVEPLLAGKTIAVARDAAFSFIYEANLDTLEALGAHLRFFSPLADRTLPDCDAIWLPGGYPELHARRLQVNTRIGDGLRLQAAAGTPIWAECGGMMPLFDAMQTADGQRYPMWGLLPGTVAMQQQLAAIGPQQLDTLHGLLRGHAFHFSSCSTPLAPCAHATPPPRHSGRGEPVYRVGTTQASYFHGWFPSNPRAVAALFRAEAFA